MRPQPSDVQLRRYQEPDAPAVLSLLQASLGWVPDEQHAAFFSWKHLACAFGPSPAWVAVDHERIVGFRAFLRWEFEMDGTLVRAVRAVDTVTHPDYQGRGVFSRLTRHALQQLAGEGVAFVFNTPNEKSRPGYLKMGWHVVGRLPAEARPRSAQGLIRMLSARVPAERWPVHTSLGVPVTAVIDEKLDALLRTQPSSPLLRTRRSREFLAWRYGYAPLGYRVLLAGTSVEDGFGVFRLRRRGAATEAALLDVIVPGGDGRAASALQRRVVQESGADYGLRLGGSGAPRAGFVAIPGHGPVLVWKAVVQGTMPALDAWALSLGDIELF